MSETLQSCLIQCNSMGNIYPRNSYSKQLPKCITEMVSNVRHPQRNIDRVMIKIHMKYPRVVEEVFITQHHEIKGNDIKTAYDENRTYKIGKRLLKEITELCQHDEDYIKQNHYQIDPDDERFRKIQQWFRDISYVHLFLYQAGYNPDTNRLCATSNRANSHR